MKKWGEKFRKNTGLSPYVWIVFYILPFYFIFHDSSTWQVAIGIAMIIGYFICYVLSFASHGWIVYIGAGMQIAISTAMSLLFGYIYFFLFLAFFIGNLKKKAAFITFYTILLVTTFGTSYYGFITHSVFITQLPFVFLSIIAVILVPVSTYNKNKEEMLQGQLEDANKRISELVKMEERQRISRDLHDTLGQKLSLIGLKSDLAAKLISKNPNQARTEIKDVQKTARITLKEVRELVMEMRGTKLEDEIYRVKQLLKAANIKFNVEGPLHPPNTSLIAENVVSMCIKEAVTNVVKHSKATACSISIEPTKTDLVVKVRDNGKGIGQKANRTKGSGLRGMKERLEFVNGNLDIYGEDGTTIVIKAPNNFIQSEDREGAERYDSDRHS
ncbi:two-component system sensor histidine kinase DesK [Evansella vedderi]|uniref:histidine kinase n=1 Tax=Evansella vedderi TaxID=38282 RepID=A0ABT9ZQG4_9BACI|nr:sensor histidine kinase [Evansella vedderi]MDQ0253486.1 two-component system sensor histidine kinase DesK [Evansella vedderi]